MDENKLRELIEQINRTFEEFKTAQNERLKQLETKGSADALLTEKVEKLNAALTELEAMKATVAQLEAQANRQGLGGSDAVRDQARTEHRKAFDRWLRKGQEGNLRELEQKAYAEALECDEERKALNITTPSDGGYAVPEVIDQNIESLVVQVSPMRSLARVITIGTSDWKKLVNVHGANGGWVGEAAARPATNSPSLAEVAAVMGEVYANPEATQQSLDDIFFNAEQWLAEEIAETFAQYEGEAFISGNGTNRPKGFLTYTTSTDVDGTRTFGHLQYIYTGTSGAFKTTSASVNPADDLLDMIYALKPAHRARATFIMNALTLAAVRKFKDNNGAYIWQPSAQAGQPGTLLGYPVVEMPDMPDYTGANAFPIALGDWQRGYYIVDRVGIRSLRDPYTNKPYVDFYTTKRLGGMVVNSEAIKLLKMGTR